MSQTHIKVDAERNILELYRLIDTRFYRIEFNIDLTVANAAPYFTMNDAQFKQFGAIIAKHDNS
jgi:hypothetical protein